jgi:D-inositol-3-phosphate glycosyltransferase
MINRQSSILPAQAGENAPRVALLTGGGDRPYVFGLAPALASKGIVVDVIGGDDLDFPELCSKPGIKFLNLRGSQQHNASFANKIFRLPRYYARLIGYAATAKPRIFHVLWNNRLETFDRTLLMLYYRLLGKKVVLTAHNVNTRRRDSNDTLLNRATLRIQYKLADHIFVHTEKMKLELIEQFGVKMSRVSVIPFGINDSVPYTRLTSREARERLGIGSGEKTILFFGRLRPSKGLEYLIAAFHQILGRCNDYRLIIAGRPDQDETYWTRLRETIRREAENGRALLRPEFIPDDETEIYFKAADALVLPYKDIYQSGVMFLAYSFGLPVISADVGSLKDEIVEGKTGFVFKPEDPVDLAKTIERYFASDLYANLGDRRPEIRDYAVRRHSWDVVSDITMNVYSGLLESPVRTERANCAAPSTPVDVNPPL